MNEYNDLFFINEADDDEEKKKNDDKKEKDDKKEEKEKKESKEKEDDDDDYNDLQIQLLMEKNNEFFGVKKFNNLMSKN